MKLSTVAHIFRTVRILLLAAAAGGCSVSRFNRPLNNLPSGPAGVVSGREILCFQLNSPFRFHSATLREEKTGRLFTASNILRTAQEKYLIVFTRLPAGKYGLASLVSINNLSDRSCFFYRADPNNLKVRFEVTAGQPAFGGDLLFIRRKHLPRLLRRFPGVKTVRLRKPYRLSRETGRTLYLADLSSSRSNHCRAAALRLTARLLQPAKQPGTTARQPQPKTGRTLPLQQLLLAGMPVIDITVTNSKPFTPASLAARRRYSPRRPRETGSGGSSGSSNLFDGLFDGLFDSDSSSSGGSNYSVSVKSHE